MGNKRTTIALIFFCIVLPFLYYIDFGGQARFYIEKAVSGHEPTFFMDFTVASIDKNDNFNDFLAEEVRKNQYIVVVPSRYRDTKLVFWGRVLNGAKDVEVEVNGKQSKVDLSPSYTNRCFWESIYLDKTFSAEMNFKRTENDIIVKSGSVKQKVTVVFQ